jgi:DNA primase
MNYDVDVLGELKAHFGPTRVKDHGRTAKIVCPYHKGGAEKTGSMIVNLQKEPVGYFWCFACGENGFLSRLLDKEFDFEATSRLAVEFDDELLDPKKKRGPGKKWKTWERWPRNRIWRTIPGWLVRELGGRIEHTKYGEKLCLPTMQFGRNQGNIHCALRKTKLAYLYDKHPFIKTSLFGFDRAEKLLKHSKTRTLFFVEGPRDTARFQAYGLPTVGNMGGITVWGPEKWDLIEYLNPRQIIVATDPDEIGNLLADAVKEAIGDMMPCGRLEFRIKYNKEGKVIHKEDPGNVPELKILQLVKRYGSTL